MTAPPAADPAGASPIGYDLTLFVIGASALSARAITNARQLCDLYLSGHYQLSVVDLLDDAEAVGRSGVLATPTLVRNAPLPVRRLVGDLSRTDRVLATLDIPVSWKRHGHLSQPTTGGAPKAGVGGPTDVCPS